MIGSFASSANTSLVAKNGTKKIFQSCWKDQYGCLDIWNVKICPLFHNLLAFLMEGKKWEKSEEEHGGGILFI